MNILFSNSERQSYWLSKRDRKLESAYAKIVPDTPFISVKHKNAYIKMCKVYFQEFLTANVKIQDIERWNTYLSC